MRVLIAAGGTGGHLMPGVAAGKELRRRGHAVHFVLRTDGASQTYLAREAFASTSFLFRGFPRGLSLSFLTYPFVFLSALLCARRTLRRERPDVVLGMGSYVSVPVALASLGTKRPLVIHEQNSRAGLANRFLSRWANKVAVSFQETEGFNAAHGLLRCTGLPLRPDLAPRDPAEARKTLGLDPDPLTLLVFGGSQGARALNRLMVSLLNRLNGDKRNIQFIHLTGPADFESVEKAYRFSGRLSFVRPFWNDMATLYSAADFVVSRSGANTVMELMRMGKRALLVPFPFATENHQEKNARCLERMGQAAVIQEKDLTDDRFLEILSALPPRGILREETQRRLAELPPEITAGASRLADLIEEAVV